MLSLFELLNIISSVVKYYNVDVAIAVKLVAYAQIIVFFCCKERFFIKYDFITQIIAVKINGFLYKKKTIKLNSVSERSWLKIYFDGTLFNYQHHRSTVKHMERRFNIY